jgi:hypothetical protein
LKLAETGQVSREIIGGFLRHHPKGEAKYLASRATSDNVEWYTPERVFAALGCRFDLDVASPGADIVPWLPADRHFTLADNGLERDWGDAYVWMNAPHGRGTLPLWLEKFREHGNGIALVVDRTSAGWWQDLCGNADLVLQVNKKIDFLRPDDEPGTNALGSSLVAYGERGVQALRNAAAAGLGTLFKPCQSIPISSQPPGLRDEDLDAYMTAPPIAEHVVAVMKSKIAEEGIPADDLWWLECCAGSGNILQHMPPDRRLGIDINPLAPGIVQADFFTYVLDPSIRWALLTNPFLSNDGPTRIFNRAAEQHVPVIGLVLPRYLRSDKAQWVNRLDPFYWCVHDQVLPRESFLRSGKPDDVPARFQIWVRRDTRREPLIEQKNHPDLDWVRKSQSAEATIWICRRGPDLGNIIEAIGITTLPEDYYGIRCSAEAVAILRSIRWRDVLDPLPSNHAPNMSRADIVRAYEAAETGQTDDADDDDHATASSGIIDAHRTKLDLESTRRVLTTQQVAEPHGSWEPKTQALPDIWHQDPAKIVEWLTADPDKAAKVWRDLGERLGLSDQRQKQQGYMRLEDQGQRDEPETRYDLPITDRARGWDTWHSKLACLDGLSYEDKLREGPALLGDFDDWLDQVQGITPAWKKHVAPS